MGSHDCSRNRRDLGLARSGEFLDLDPAQSLPLLRELLGQRLGSASVGREELPIGDISLVVGVICFATCAFLNL